MTTTSREYAEALFELAVQGNVTEETSEGLETVISALMQTPEYRALLASPAIGKEERLNALDSAFRGKIPDILLAILRMMISRGQVSALNGMARDYEELARGYRGETVAVVTSAVPLKEAEAVALINLIAGAMVTTGASLILIGVIGLWLTRREEREREEER